MLVLKPARRLPERSPAVLMLRRRWPAVPADHPLRSIRATVDNALSGLAGEFEALYSPLGRLSMPPERLLRALLLQALYSVGRSDC